VQVLEQASLGWSTTEIARVLFVSHSTVQTHLRRLMVKLGARNRAHAVRLAFERRVLGGGEFEREVERRARALTLQALRLTAPERRSEMVS
jgi:DNA-binding CsgD family transcriptional regulator